MEHKLRKTIYYATHEVSEDEVEGVRKLSKELEEREMKLSK